MIRKQRRAAALLFIGALASASVVAGSLALFTDQDTVGANDFTAGTIVLTPNGTSAVIGYSDMLPGDSVHQQITITNDGTGEFRYAMTSLSTDGATDAVSLSDQLDFKVYEPTANSCADETQGAVIFDGKLADAAFGDATTGADFGDRVLASGSSEVLCLYAHLPIETGNAWQATQTSTAFTFDAEQTANN
jgi:predicted ribosomally synthesized peptide with SipW-like signal peptide